MALQNSTTKILAQCKRGLFFSIFFAGILAAPFMTLAGDNQVRATPGLNNIVEDLPNI